MSEYAVYLHEGQENPRPVAWFSEENRAKEYLALVLGRGENATYESLAYLKVEIAINEKQLEDSGYSVNKAWNYIDNLFCGEKRHMIKELRGDTRRYTAEYDEGESWGNVMSGMSLLYDQQWFQDCVTKMLYYRSDGWVEDAIDCYIKAGRR